MRGLRLLNNHSYYYIIKILAIYVHRTPKNMYRHASNRLLRVYNAKELIFLVDQRAIFADRLKISQVCSTRLLNRISRGMERVP